MHMEEIVLMVLEDSTVDVVLGHPWLEQHDPILSWRTGEILSPLEARSVNIPACYSHFWDVFCPKKASKLPPHQPWDCAIDLIPSEPVPKGRIYSLTLLEEKAMEEYIKEALAQGYIHPSTSPAASSFFFVAKRDGGLQPCIDYRALNKITVKFRYPLPLIHAALERLHGTTVFTKLDLRSTYKLIRIRKGDEWKTAFVTPTGHYEYGVMPYGLANAPSVFEDFMHKVLQDFLHKFVVVYIDDILIYSRSMADHQRHVAEVLHRLRDYNLFLKAEKCLFHQHTVQFLGYAIDRSGVRMDEKKVTAVRDWPTPTTVKELQRFLGFANFYRRFIRGYSSVTSPLTNLLRNKPKTLVWTPAATHAFQTLKRAFTTAPLLVHPDPELPFIVEVDASTTGVDGVLSQQQGNPQKLHPCTFFSRKLNPAEVNYDSGNRELLAVKLTLEEWRHWLEGAKHPFTVLTDHKNLEYLRAAKRLNPRQARWALFFTRFKFAISYRPGSKNVKADALSRIYGPDIASDDPEPILPEKIFASPISWLEDTLPESGAPPGCPPGLQFIPRSHRTSLIHSTHVSLGTGHPAIKGTLSLLQQCFWWPRMAVDVKRYVQGCRECAMSKSPRHLPAGKLLPLPVPNRPWSLLGIDFIVDVPAFEGCTCVLVIVDRFSKACRLMPLPRPPTALEMAEYLFNHVFRYYGLPADIVSDRGPQFTSRVWRAFFKRLGVTISLSSGYHPQTNGQTERKIQALPVHLLPWPPGILESVFGLGRVRPELTVAVHHRPHPFQCLLSYQPSLFPWDGEPSDVPAVDYWFRESKRVWGEAHRQLQRALRRRRTTADLRRMEGGESVQDKRRLVAKRGRGMNGETGRYPERAVELRVERQVEISMNIRRQVSETVQSINTTNAALCVEFVTVRCRQFYLPREFTTIFIVGVYIPPCRNDKEALCELCGAISELQNAHPDRLFIIATRGVNTLDLVYTNIPSAYRAEPRPNLSYSDHISVMLIPAYRPLIRHSKPVLKLVKTWPEGATSALQDCFECTDWDMFREAATKGDTTDLEEYMSSVTSYISKCIDDVTISRSITTHSNQKPWMTAKVCALLRIHGHFQSSSDTRRMWQGIQTITNYRPVPPACDSDASLLDALNSFYSRFEAQNDVTVRKTIPPQEDQVLCLTTADVRKTLFRVNPRKVAGPDNIPGRVLRECAEQLADVFTDIFNISLSSAISPSTAPSLFCLLPQYYTSHSRAPSVLSFQCDHSLYPWSESRRLVVLTDAVDGSVWRPVSWRQPWMETLGD
ncbi:hypothetical protein QTP70_001152 [Hemibagrus guttatus]|uniref:Gypsy retrotransposon integrase-like protein 1 n=1 Tax=Hemibagrus guttatus TaxID=175788 RepID=A0AAE0PSI9_9TELE|nr:hypothetical protein QTP70_001152 [Hemibagrus guttatus]